jgi:hypothetical protein
MAYRANSARGRKSGFELGVQTIPNHMALALVGQTVSLRDRGNAIHHGVVAGVVTEIGRPKLVVNRVEYDLNQVLSVTPTVFN